MKNINYISLFGILFLLSVGFVSAYPVWEKLTTTGESIYGSLVSINAVTDDTDLFISLMYNNTGSLVKLDLSTNIVTNVSSTILPQFGNMVYHDGLIYSVGRNGSLLGGYFFVLNVSTGVVTDLTDTDATVGNWLPTNFNSNKLVYDDINDKLYVGLSSYANFAVYDPVTNIFTNLNNTDTDNWAGTKQVNALAVDTVNNRVYTGGNQGVFGVYNPANNIWSPLPITYLSIRDMVIDYENNLLYTIELNVTGQPQLLIAYNISDFTQKTIILTLPDTASFGGIMTLDATTHWLYFSTQLAGYDKTFQRYNTLTHTIEDLTSTDIGNWVTGTDYPRNFNLINNKLYTLMNSKTMGVYYDSNTCVENWISADTECYNMRYTVGYVDSNNCGTRNNVPSDNGLSMPCSGAWRDLSRTDVGDFFYSTSMQGILYDSKDDLAYFGAGYLSNLQSGGVQYTPLFGIYNPKTGITTKVNVSFDAFLVDFDKDVANNKLYIAGGGNAQLAVYDITTGVLTDLSATDTKLYGGNSSPNWQGNNSNVYNLVVDEVHGLVFTTSPGGRLGMYNISDGTWYNLVNTDLGNWFGTNALYGVCFDGVDKVYTTGSNKLGFFNISDNVWYNLNNANVNPWLVAMSACAYDTNHNLLYLGTSSSTNGLVFGVYNPTTRTITDLSGTDTDNWFGTSTFSGGGKGISYDAVNNVVYTTGSQGKLGIYDPATNIWTDLSKADTNNWASTFSVYDNAVDTKNNRVYTIHDRGMFGVYSTTLPSCIENWTSSIVPNICINGTQTKVYTDAQNCGTTKTLPSDNGTKIYCCVEKWVPQLQPARCTSGAQQLTYTDANKCGTINFLPANNGTTQNCCAESWLQYLYPTKCTNGTQQVLYRDRNVCNTTYFLPTNNGSMQSCNFCTENWIRKVTPNRCLNGTQFITYTDKNICNTTTYLPTDNGTYQACCMEQWTKYLDPQICTSGIQQILYTDQNSCGTNILLPANNGTFKICCVENWAPYLKPTTCINGTQQLLYKDLNKCGTTLTRPIDYGTTQTCCIENWIKTLQPPTCTTGRQTIVYLDQNSCGTTNYLPRSNGTTQRCQIPRK